MDLHRYTDTDEECFGFSRRDSGTGSDRIPGANSYAGSSKYSGTGEQYSVFQDF